MKDEYNWTRKYRVHQRNYRIAVREIGRLQRKAQRSQAKMYEYEDKLWDLGIDTDNIKPLSVTEDTPDTGTSPTER